MVLLQKALVGKFNGLEGKEMMGRITSQVIFAETSTRRYRDYCNHLKCSFPEQTLLLDFILNVLGTT